MANRWYKKGAEAVLGSVDLLADTIKATLLDSGVYTPATNTDQYMNTNTIAAAAKIGSPVTLTGKSVTDGVFDCTDPVFALVTGASAELVAIWKDGGGGGTSASGTTDLLLILIDTATGLPVTPNGGNINLLIDNGANKIAAIA